jgi:hypothetical protein
LALRFIQHSALGLEAHKASLPLLTGLYLDLQAKGAPFPPVEDAEVCVCVCVCASACGGGCMAALPAVIEPTLLS